MRKLCRIFVLLQLQYMLILRATVIFLWNQAKGWIQNWFAQIFLTLRGWSCITHHFHSAEDMTEVVATLQILGNISKSAEVIWVLGGTRDVPDLMLRNYSLMEKGRKWVLTGNQPLMEAERVNCDVSDGQINTHRDTQTYFNITFVAASMNLTPLYVMDRITTGPFLESFDFCNGHNKNSEREVH